MKKFPLTRIFMFAVALTVSTHLPGFAQLPNLGLGNLGNLGGGALATDFAALAKLFGDHKAFTAKLDVRVYDENEKDKASVPMDFARLDDKMRMELDAEQLVNAAMPGGSGAFLKQLNMDRIILTLRPDQEARFLTFPGIQSTLKNALTAAEKADFAKQPKLETTALGKETLDGRACVKSKVVATDDKGTQTEYTVWRATDLKDFPVQIITKEKKDTVIMRYKDVKLAKPDAKLFDTPADCKEYTDSKEMLQAVMMKMMNDAAAAAATTDAAPPATPAKPAAAPEKSDKSEK